MKIVEIARDFLEFGGLATRGAKSVICVQKYQVLSLGAGTHLRGVRKVSGFIARNASARLSSDFNGMQWISRGPGASLIARDAKSMKINENR